MQQCGRGYNSSSAGHLLSTAQVESALVEHEAVAEAAVVGTPHPIKGESLYCFVTLTEGVAFSRTLEAELRKRGGWKFPSTRSSEAHLLTDVEFLSFFVLAVREKIGAIATPDYIQNAPGLPKTRSGKVLTSVGRADRQTYFIYWTISRTGL